MAIVERECVVCYCEERDKTPARSLLSVLLMQASGRSYDEIYRALCFNHRRTIDRGMQLAGKAVTVAQGIRTLEAEPE